MCVCVCVCVCVRVCPVLEAAKNANYPDRFLIPWFVPQALLKFQTPPSLRGTTHRFNCMCREGVVSFLHGDIHGIGSHLERQMNYIAISIGSHLERQRP